MPVLPNPHDLRCFGQIARQWLDLVSLPFVFVSKLVQRQEALAAENLFLRRQLALLMERGARPRRPDDATRLAMALLSRLFDWREALLVVQPDTLIRWHRQGFRLLWKWKSRPGRPPIPQELRELIREMAMDNPLWGEERIASELLLKLGIRVSPRTVRKYMPKKPRPRGRSRQGWSTFLRNHAGVLACDFLTAVSVRYQLLYILVILDIQSHRIVHVNVTSHPTAAWVLQQFREALPWEHDLELLIHDRDAIFSRSLDQQIEAFGMKVWKTPPRTPLANAFCERVNGTIRRECLDHLIPLGEEHLRRILKEWMEHYNRGRPHSSLGPGLPAPTPGLPAPLLLKRHSLPPGTVASKKPVLGGLHHEYRMEPTRPAAVPLDSG